MPVIYRTVRHSERIKSQPKQRVTRKESSLSPYACAVTDRQKKHLSDENGTTPHPPAGFGSRKFFSFIFLQTDTPARAAATGFLRATLN